MTATAPTITIELSDLELTALLHMARAWKSSELGLGSATTKLGRSQRRLRMRTNAEAFEQELAQEVQE